jgi:hypothetical protein
VTNEEYARVTDLTRLENARWFLRELETIDGDALAAHLRVPISLLRNEIKIKSQRADAGKPRTEEKQGTLLSDKGTPRT